MKTVSFQLEDALADKFELAVQLTGDSRDEIAAQFIRQYLAKAFRDAADAFDDPHEHQQVPPPPHRQAPPPPVYGRPNHQRPPRPDYWQEWGKAIKRIPRWARNPQQNNHKILRAFFELQQEIGKVTLDALRSRCSDPNGHPNTYVPHFDNNFAQMKFDNGNSHGKVFEEHNGFITIWDHISDTLMKYRDFFL